MDHLGHLDHLDQGFAKSSPAESGHRPDLIHFCGSSGLAYDAYLAHLAGSQRADRWNRLARQQGNRKVVIITGCLATLSGPAAPQWAPPQTMGERCKESMPMSALSFAIVKHPLTTVRGVSPPSFRYTLICQPALLRA